tara:strand:+ start:203 stop:322 length:120 start_codon:yes stop_codon:yes gene_type:complete
MIPAGMLGVLLNEYADSPQAVLEASQNALEGSSEEFLVP